MNFNNKLLLLILKKYDIENKLNIKKIYLLM